MIKLKDLLELKTMVYSDEVKPKHEKKINKTTKLFHNELTLPMIKPPENDHSITLDELKYLESVEPNEQYVKDGDEILDAFKPLIEKYDVNISEEYFKTVENISTNKSSDNDVVSAEKEGIRIGLLYAMNVFSSYPKKPISPVEGVGSSATLIFKMH